MTHLRLTSGVPGGHFHDKKANSTPSFIESDGSFITKPTDIANYFTDFFIGKISKLRDDMPATNGDTTHPSLSDQIIKEALYF